MNTLADSNNVLRDELPAEGFRPDDAASRGGTQARNAQLEQSRPTPVAPESDADYRVYGSDETSGMRFADIEFTGRKRVRRIRGRA